MLPTTRYAWLLALAGLTLSGCSQNPFLTPQQQTAMQQQQTTQQSQVQELERRVGELDVSNRDLHTRLAQSEQQQQIYRDQTQLLQQQLRDTANQLRETQLARQDAEKSVQTLQASTRKQGGAMITANNSVRQSLATIDIPGVEVRQDQDVIRIEMPADELFQAGTVQLVPSAYAYLDKVAEAIARNYPRQRIAIEGHTDSAPTFNGTTTTTSVVVHAGAGRLRHAHAAQPPAGAAVVRHGPGSQSSARIERDGCRTSEEPPHRARHLSPDA